MKNKVQYLIFIAAALTYLLFGYGVIVSNDSVTNIDQIVSLDLWSRSSHFSFHFFGIIFYLIFSKLIGLSAIASVELMLAVISTSTAVALYQITLNKYNNVTQALITVIIYALASGIFRFSCQVEYLVMVPSFGIISLYFYSKGQNIIAGIFFGLGLLTSPFAVLIVPLFFIFTSPGAIFRKRNIIFAGSTIAMYFAVNIFTYQETISGHWSYGGIFNLYKEVYNEINLTRTAAIYFYGYLRSFNILIVIIPFVVYYLYKSNKELFYVLVTTIIIHLPATISEARYGGYQMTAYPVIAIAAGYYLIMLVNKQKTILLFLIAMYALINFYLVYSERAFFRDLKETYVQLSDNLQDNSVLIVYQASKPIKNIYAPNLQVIDLLTDYQNARATKIPGFVPTDLTSVLNSNDTLYVLESGVSMPDDYLKLLVSKFTKKQGAKVKGFALEKILAQNPLLDWIKLKDYPLDVYKLTIRNYN